MGKEEEEERFRLVGATPREGLSAKFSAEGV